ncbi:MAG TPA: EVE domain-containing protein [Bacteroidia bacterium]|jgi:predicted RNA-binding protein with PUA-like domain|nr:EVE domain-containing protein [Bacteroidia bacterium]
MNYWLVKSEPSVYSWEKFVKDKKTVWDGVRNYAARLHLRAMKKDDQVFFYHSNEGMCIVGIAKVVKEGYPDPKEKDWTVVDLAPVEALKKPVSLQDIKAEKKLATIPLIRIGRLSVMPIKKEEYEIIMRMSR